MDVLAFDPLYRVHRFQRHSKRAGQRDAAPATDLNQPIGEWKKAWRLAFEEGGVRYRWHDCRQSFLAENPHVSEATIKSLAGHVSKRMLERYSHIRTPAERDAIAVLDGRNEMLPLRGRTIG
jgi:integrase